MHRSMATVMQGLARTCADIVPARKCGLMMPARRAA